jgi:hypothetical protein
VDIDVREWWRVTAGAGGIDARRHPVRRAPSIEGLYEAVVRPPLPVRGKRVEGEQLAIPPGATAVRLAELPAR